jgi:hypothetical protein
MQEYLHSLAYRHTRLLHVYGRLNEMQITQLKLSLYGHRRMLTG